MLGSSIFDLEVHASNQQPVPQRFSAVFCCQVALLCLSLCNPMGCSPPSSSVHGILQARILQWYSHFLLQRIFLTQGLIPHLLHWQVDSLPLSHLGSPQRFLVEGSSALGDTWPPLEMFPFVTAGGRQGLLAPVGRGQGCHSAP